MANENDFNAEFLKVVSATSTLSVTVANEVEKVFRAKPGTLESLFLSATYCDEIVKRTQDAINRLDAEYHMLQIIYLRTLIAAYQKVKSETTEKIQAMGWG
jgi:hypothetical protein